MRIIRVLLVDDEERQRATLKKLIPKLTDRFEIVGEASSVDSAIQAIERYAPDLVFLDVEMGDGTGFDVLAGVGAQRHSFQVVFATAFTHYGLDAFKQHALHYLVKPFSREDLRNVIDRVHIHFDTHISHNVSNGDVVDKRAATQNDEGRSTTGHLPSDNATSEAHASASSAPSALAVTDGNVRYYIATEQIIYCEAAKNYTRIYVSEPARKLHQITSPFLTVSKNIGELTATLMLRGFIRIHRAYCINKRYVLRVINEGATHFAVIDTYGDLASAPHLSSVVKLPITDLYYPEFRARMEG
jgi:two-component system LytT family response regulator